MKKTMQKSRKRLGALALATAMMLGALPLTAAAPNQVTTVTGEMRPQVSVMVDGVERDFYNAQGQQEQTELDAIVQALADLNTLRGLYNQGRYSDARDFLAHQELNADNTYVTEENLALYAEKYADPAQLEIYNPLEAWQQLVSWLG